MKLVHVLENLPTKEILKEIESAEKRNINCSKEIERAKKIKEEGYDLYDINNKE